MRTILSLAVIVVIGSTWGCRSGRTLVTDCRLYDSGELRSVGGVASDSKQKGLFEAEHVKRYGYASEYFKNGRLKSEQWSDDGGPLVQLEFYENGRLKSEERFDNDKLSYGAYYSKEGKPEKTIGQRSMSDATCR